MSKYQFIKFEDKNSKKLGYFDYTRLEYTTETESLSEILEEFKHFLCGCGYTVNGEIEVVNYDNLEENNEHD